MQSQVDATLGLDKLEEEGEQHSGSVTGGDIDDFGHDSWEMSYEIILLYLCIFHEIPIYHLIYAIFFDAIRLENYNS